MTLVHALRTVVLAFAVSLAAGMYGTAHAAIATITDLGTIHEGPPTAFSGSVLTPGPFADAFTFILPVNGGSGYSVVNFPLDIPGFGTFSTLFTSLTLFTDPNGTPYDGDEIQVAQSMGGSTPSLSLTFGSSAGGNMILQVDGATAGTKGGLYSGAISVTPIPEPAVWAMMLSGIGLVGWMRLRNRGKALA